MVNPNYVSQDPPLDDQQLNKLLLAICVGDIDTFDQMYESGKSKLFRSDDCPSLPELRASVLSESERFAGHLQGCEYCRAIVETIHLEQMHPRASELYYYARQPAKTGSEIATGDHFSPADRSSDDRSERMLALRWHLEKLGCKTCQHRVAWFRSDRILSAFFRRLQQGAMRTIDNLVTTAYPVSPFIEGRRRGWAMYIPGSTPQQQLQSTILSFDDDRFSGTLYPDHRMEISLMDAGAAQPRLVFVALMSSNERGRNLGKGSTQDAVYHWKRFLVLVSGEVASTVVDEDFPAGAIPVLCECDPADLSSEHAKLLKESFTSDAQGKIEVQNRWSEFATIALTQPEVDKEVVSVLSSIASSWVGDPGGMLAAAASIPKDLRVAATEGDPDSGPYEIIRSPVEGTFMGIDPTTNAPYVEVGDWVSEDTVVGMIEAMRVFFPVQAETNGWILESLVTEGSHVDQDQPLFKVDS